MKLRIAAALVALSALAAFSQTVTTTQQSYSTTQPGIVTVTGNVTATTQPGGGILITQSVSAVLTPTPAATLPATVPASSPSTQPATQPASQPTSQPSSQPTSPTVLPVSTGAMIITAGGTYPVNLDVLSTTGAVITVKTTAPVTITGIVEGRGSQLIASGVSGTNITLSHLAGIADNPNVNGQAMAQAIEDDSPTTLTIDHCGWTNVGGYAIHPKSATGAVKITNNTFTDVNGMYSNGAGGYQAAGTATPHAIILETCTGGGEIGWNQIINSPGASYVNDIVNLYDSSGTAANPLNVHDNYIDGLYAISPTTQYDSGCGIICDGEITPNETAFVTIQNNQVISAGNAGIGIAAGHDITVSGNTLICPMNLPPAYTTPFYSVNVGMYEFDYMTGGSASTFFNIKTINNTWGWLQAPNTNSKKTVATRNDYWPGTSGPTITFSGNVSTPTSAANNVPTAPNATDVAAQWSQWQLKLSANNETVGP